MHRGRPLSAFQFPSSGQEPTTTTVSPGAVQEHCTSRSMRQGTTLSTLSGSFSVVTCCLSVFPAKRHPQCGCLLAGNALQELIQGPQMGHDRADRLPRCLWRGYVYQLHGLEHGFYQSCTSTSALVSFLWSKRS